MAIKKPRDLTGWAQEPWPLQKVHSAEQSYPGQFELGLSTCKQGGVGSF